MAIVALPYPIQLINGNTADGGQVQTDLNFVASQVNANAAKNGVNNDITALTALVSISAGLTITGATIFGSTFTNGSIVGSTIDATSTVPTAANGTNTNQIASTAFVINTAFAGTLPGISPAVTDNFVTNNGVIASWSFLLKAGTIRFADSADPTKRLAFNVAAITTGTTRTITQPDGDVFLQTDNDRAEELFAYSLYF